MDKYELIFNKIQEKYESGEMTLEQAEAVNNMAYEKYVNESVDEEVNNLILENATNAYNEIFDYLSEAYENNELTYEEAAELNDYYYDQIFNEGKAFNKYMDKTFDDYTDRVRRKGKMRGSMDLLGKLVKSKIHTTGNGKHSHSNDIVASGYRKVSKDGNGNVDKRSIQVARKEFNAKHGDVGQRPEEKYVKGRYLEKQADKDKDLSRLIAKIRRIDPSVKIHQG